MGGAEDPFVGDNDVMGGEVDGPVVTPIIILTPMVFKDSPLFHGFQGSEWGEGLAVSVEEEVGEHSVNQTRRILIRVRQRSQWIPNKSQK